MVSFVTMVYDIKKKKVSERWEIKGSFSHEALQHFVECCTCSFKLVTEVVSRIFGGLPIRRYGLVNERMGLLVSLDTVPVRKALLNLPNGSFVRGADACIKLPGELFDCPAADVALAELLLRPTGALHTCVTDVLRYDKSERFYREYQASNGVWKCIDEGAAEAIVSKGIGALLWPMYHLQSFRELHDPEFSRKTPVVFPKSVTVKDMIGNYVQKMRNASAVLKLLRQKLTVAFDANSHPSLLCFENGVLDLETGLLQGPAAPGMLITQCVPRVYDPTVDTKDLVLLMQSFFPAVCYEDSQDVLAFYQMWRGFCITGVVEDGPQTSLWLTGRGCNGKSVLAAFDKHVWGAEICSSISMSAFQQAGAGNNDHLYYSRTSRSVSIVENSDALKMNEEVFKKAVAGDEMSVQGKYKTGVTCQFPSKYTFYQNDAPAWSCMGAFSIRRRIWNLPLRAQHLLPEQESERMQLKIEGKAHCIINRVPGFGVLKELKQKHVQAYMKWAVQGAVLFHKSHMRFNLPQTVKLETEREGRDKKADFDQFIRDYLICDPKACLATAEIREVFLRHGRFEVSTTAQITSMLDSTLASILVPDHMEGKPKLQPLLPGVAKVRLTYPSRVTNSRPMGYRGVNWRPGEIATFVNKVRSTYVNNTLPPIQKKPEEPGSERHTNDKDEHASQTKWQELCVQAWNKKQQDAQKRAKIAEERQTLEAEQDKIRLANLEKSMALSELDFQASLRKMDVRPHAKLTEFFAKRNCGNAPPDVFENSQPV